MSVLPVNVEISDLLLVPAHLPGCCPVLVIYRRLDRGQVIHGEYVGLVPATEQLGQALEVLTSAARSVAQGG